MKKGLIQVVLGLIYAVLITIISMGVPLLLSGVIFGRNGMNELMVDSTNLLMGILGTPLAIFITKKYYQKYARNVTKEIDFLEENKNKKIVTGLILGFATVFVIVVGLILVGAKISFNGFANWFSILSGVSTFIGMATLEECIFRGVLRRTFSIFGNKVGNVLPILLFTTLHMDLWQTGNFLRVIDLLMAGIFFTIVLYRSNSMLLTSMTHASVNISAAILFGVDTKSGIFTTSFTEILINLSGEQVSTILSILVSLIFSVLIFVYWKKSLQLEKQF